MEQLTDAKVSRDLLKKASATIAYMQKAGFKLEQGFPKGKFGPDRMVIQATISTDLIKDRLSSLLNIPNSRRYDIFPYGILIDDFYRIRVEIGSRQAF